MKRNELLSMGTLLLLASPIAFSANPDSANIQPNEAFDKLPLAFEANVGQTDPKVKFLTHGKGYTAFLTSDGAVLKLVRKTTQTAPLGVAGSAEGVAPELGKHEINSAVIRMRLVGASAEAKISPDGPLAARISYVNGSSGGVQPSLFERVTYRDVWPGISMLYHGKEQQMEYDFVISPGVSPSAIRLAFEGSNGIRLDSNGDLVLSTEAGELRQPAPGIYQEINGHRNAVQGGYVLTADREVAFNIGSYDRTQPLVIDPTLQFADTWHASGDDYIEAIAIDNRTGEIVVAGYTDSTDFPGYNMGSSPTRSNAFVCKLNPAGSKLEFCTVFGGSWDDDARGIAIDGYGNIYVTGQTQSSDFSPLPPCTTPVCPFVIVAPHQIASDFFVVELDASGHILFRKQFGGSYDDYGNAIAVDAAGYVYVAGRTYSPDFPVQTVSQSYGSNHLSGPSDAFLFVLTIQPSGQATIVDSFFFGGAGDETIKSIAVIQPTVAVHAQGIYPIADIFVGGWTNSINFPTWDGWQMGYRGGNSDGFVARFSFYHVNLTAPPYYYLSLDYSTYIGGEGEDAVYGIYVDPSGILHATGYTRSFYFPVTYDCYQRYYGGGNADAFVVKLGGNGAVQFATYLGGSGDDYGRAIVVDDYDHPYVVGYTDSRNFPTTNGSRWQGGWDIFASVFQNDGQYLAYSSYFGWWNDEFAYCAARDSYGNLYVGGSTDSTYDGDTDVLLFKLVMN